MKLRSGTVCLLAALASCSVWAQSSENSGFLANYSQLKPMEGRPNVRAFIDHSFDYSKYSKLFFKPVQVIVTPGAEQQALDPDTVKRISDNLDTAVKNALGQNYQVVAAPGADVLEVRLGVTGVQPVRTDLKATDFIPIKALFNIARSAAGDSPRVAEMTGEMEVTDSAGKVLIAAAAVRKGDATLAKNDRVTWQEMDPIMQYWAQGFRNLLDNLRGVAPQP